MTRRFVACYALAVPIDLSSEERKLIASDASVPFDDADFLRAVLEAVPLFIVRLDPDWRINYINHLRGGLTLADVIGKPACDFIAPEHYPRFEAAVEQAMRTGQSSSYTVKGSHLTGGTLSYFDGLAVPLDHGDGRRGVCVVALDVTERVVNTEALKASEDKLRIAVEATGIGLWTWELSTDKLEWNTRMTEITGFPATTASDYVERIVHPSDRERMRAELADARAGVANFPVHRIARPDGEVRWLLPCGRRIDASDGGVVRLTGGMLDVTAQRLTDERLRQSQKLDAVGSLTAGVAHNFNNMLAVIVPALELAERQAGAGERRLFADAIAAARRSAELVSQLMTFAGQRRATSPQAHDLAALVEGAVSMCQRTFDASGTDRHRDRSRQRSAPGRSGGNRAGRRQFADQRARRSRRGRSHRAVDPSRAVGGDRHAPRFDASQQRSLPAPARGGQRRGHE